MVNRAVEHIEQLDRLSAYLRMLPDQVEAVFHAGILWQRIARHLIGKVTDQHAGESLFVLR